MRQQRRVGQGNQFRRHLRFLRIDVEPGRKDRAVAQRRNQRLLVDRAAPPDIDEDAVRAKRLQYGRVDDLVGCSTAGRDRDQRVDCLGKPASVG